MNGAKRAFVSLIFSGFPGAKKLISRLLWVAWRLRTQKNYILVYGVIILILHDWYETQWSLNLNRSFFRNNNNLWKQKSREDQNSKISIFLRKNTFF